MLAQLKRFNYSDKSTLLAITLAELKRFAFSIKITILAIGLTFLTEVEC
jgi:hypothetical protein